ncbi:Hsp20/alpha crystallin family protein [Methylohalobius crimeensis]|uniref:Hsp20/alpha crystallin family protein n=1 Tax=Methylohalobius crimeensis TaxID=244365 RepID=UPI0003B7B27C|nr:Hsp20/alpha crystallin family protein [Methylohalobius crimeensis]
MAQITRYEPWTFLNQLQRELERSFESMRSDMVRGGEEMPAAAEWAPAVDIKEKANQYVVHADLPGVKPDDIEITLENSILTIKGHRETEAKEEQEDYKRVERVYGGFFRRFALPDSVDADKIQANYEQGVLIITIPKKAEVQPKKITVKTA